MITDTLVKETKQLSKRLQKSEQMMSAIKSDMDNWWNPDEVTKELIRKLLDQAPNLDEGDIADRLNLDLELVCQSCDELLAEGKIKSIPY